MQNDLDVFDAIEEYKKTRNLGVVKEQLIAITAEKKRSAFSTIRSVNNKIAKFNLFRRYLRQIEVVQTTLITTTD